MEHYITFHRILDLLESYVDKSPIMKSFGYGNLVDFGKIDEQDNPNAEQPVEYPYMFVVPQQISYDENTTTYSLNLLFADILNTDLSNEKDIVSDMSLQARRFLSYVKRGFDQDPPLYDIMDTNLPVAALPFMERFADHVAGVGLQFDLIVFEDINACDYYPSPTPTPTNTTTPSPTPTITPTNTTTPTYTPSPTPTCNAIVQYLEVMLEENTKFKLILWDQPDFTYPANAQCDYSVSGTAYGSLGTVYTGTETILSGQHQKQFNLSPVLQPGEIVTGFTVYNITLIGCSGCTTIVNHCALFEANAGGSGSNFYWTDCNGIAQTTFVAGSGITTFCALQGTTSYDGGGSIVELGNCQIV